MLIIAIMIIIIIDIRPLLLHIIYIQLFRWWSPAFLHYATDAYAATCWYYLTLAAIDTCHYMPHWCITNSQAYIGYYTAIIHFITIIIALLLFIDIDIATYFITLIHIGWWCHYICYWYITLLIYYITLHDDAITLSCYHYAIHIIGHSPGHYAYHYWFAIIAITCCYYIIYAVTLTLPLLLMLILRFDFPWCYAMPPLILRCHWYYCHW